MSTIIHNRITSGLLIIFLLFLTQVANAAYSEPDKTPELVQKKAVIIKHNARLFRRPYGYYGKEAPFMQIYFLMKPSSGNRVPVSTRPSKTGYPDGWLEKGSFVEWNTLQMIKLEPQSGRKLAKIFNNQYCAELFGKSAQAHSGCKVLGEEPNRFISQSNMELLIPVFKKSRKSYQGGFIRVYEKGSTIRTTQSFVPRNNAQQASNRMGYDIVFVVDSNRSSNRNSNFAPMIEVLQGFIKKIQNSVKQNQIQNIRMGVVFYRKRPNRNRSCNIGYLTKWGQHLTTNLDALIKALGSEKELNCYGNNQSEAVLDGVNRVLYETRWKDNHFKSIILIGDTPPPHVFDYRNNPMRLSVSRISKVAAKKNIRILAFKLGDHHDSFKKMALETVGSNQGRYKNIPQMQNADLFKKDLFKAMTDEWRILSIAQNMIKNVSNSGNNRSGNNNSKALLENPNFRKKYNISQYEALIIRARLPETLSGSQVIPEFIKGWVPQEIHNQMVVGEFILMDRFHLSKVLNTLEQVSDAASKGLQEGGVAFIKTLQSVLAAQTKISSNQLFRSGASLNHILKKANILPFKTDILTFTAQEVNTWKPEDYKRVNMILKEKVKIIGEFMSNPQHVHYFGNKAHYYVPKAFFP